jgi:Flp pilus assembly protein TadD
MGLGACFLNTGRRQLAFMAYSKALELDPSNVKLKQWIDTNQAMQNPAPAAR